MSWTFSTFAYRLIRLFGISCQWWRLRMVPYLPHSPPCPAFFHWGFVLRIWTTFWKEQCILQVWTRGPLQSNWTPDPFRPSYVVILLQQASLDYSPKTCSLLVFPFPGLCWSVSSTTQALTFSSESAVIFRSGYRCLTCSVVFVDMCTSGVIVHSSFVLLMLNIGSLSSKSVILLPSVRSFDNNLAVSFHAQTRWTKSKSISENRRRQRASLSNASDRLNICFKKFWWALIVVRVRCKYVPKNSTAYTMGSPSRKALSYMLFAFWPS